ncbi:MAG TPA: hypothetical protein VK399_10425 [Longimicrobiaceae bacterium]|nr:hypothetical protein [Longimicrobiaceae bacterium]
MILVMCLGLALLRLWELPAAWQDWRAGVTDSYPGEHRGRLVEALGDLALTLAIPLPVVGTRIRSTQHLRRRLLYGAWAVLMGVAVLTLALRYTRYTR